MNPAYAMNVREINRVISAVNSRKTAEEAGLKTETELELYRRMWAEAQAYLSRGGVWPVFELCQLD